MHGVNVTAYCTRQVPNDGEKPQDSQGAKIRQRQPSDKSARDTTIGRKHLSQNGHSAATRTRVKVGHTLAGLHPQHPGLYAPEECARHSLGIVPFSLPVLFPHDEGNQICRGKPAEPLDYRAIGSQYG